MEPRGSRGQGSMIPAHPIHGESKLKSARYHCLVPVVHLPRLSRALRDHLDNQHRIKRGRPRETKFLPRAPEPSSDAYLIHHFGGELSRARGPHQAARASLSGHRWLDMRVVFLVAAAHHRQLSAFRPGLCSNPASRYRRPNKLSRTSGFRSSPQRSTAPARILRCTASFIAIASRFPGGDD